MILYGKWHSVAVTWCSIAAIQLPLPPKLGRNKGGVTQERKKTAIGLSPKRCKIWPRLLYDGLIGNKSYTRFRLEKKIEVWCGPHHTSFSNSHHTSFEKKCGVVVVMKKVWCEFGKVHTTHLLKRSVVWIGRRLSLVGHRSLCWNDVFRPTGTVLVLSCSLLVGPILIFYYRAMLCRSRLCHSILSARLSVRNV